MKVDYPKGISFECNGCGLCCGDTPQKNRHVLLLKAEAERISAHTGQSVSEFAEETERKEPYVYEMRKKQGKCLFLKEDNICSIYALRPLICRFYPFMLETEGNSHKFTATSECPRIASPKSGECGKVLDFFYFRRLLKTARSALQDSAASESV